MKITTLLGWAVGVGVLYTVTKNSSANSVNTNTNASIHLPQVVQANNGGYVVYQNDYFKVDDINAQSIQLNLTARQAQIELDSNTTIGQVVLLSIMNIIDNQTDRPSDR